MTKNKQRGTAFETAVARFLQEKTKYWVERRALAGSLDKGDLIVIPDWCLELKDHKSINLAGFMDEAAKESENAGTKWHAAIVKRRNRNVKDAYVVMPLWMWAEFIERD